MRDIVERLRTAPQTDWPDNASGMCFEAADEIERLRTWKFECMAVLSRWEEVAELIPMQPGDVKSQAVKDWVQKVQAAAVIDEALSKLEGES